MSACAQYAQEQWELADLDQSDPSREEMLIEELRTLPRWRIQAIRATYAGTCWVCLGEIQPSQAIYYTRTGKRRQWHVGCLTLASQPSHISAAAHTSSDPATALTAGAKGVSGLPEAMSPPVQARPFLLPVPVLVGAPGRRMTPATLIAEVPYAD